MCIRINPHFNKLKVCAKESYMWRDPQSFPSAVPQYNLSSFCRVSRVIHGPSLAPVANLCRDHLMGVLEPMFFPHVLLTCPSAHNSLNIHPISVKSSHVPSPIHYHFTRFLLLLFYIVLYFGSYHS